MNIYPVYEALFLGSNDCMCHTIVRVAALSKRDGRKKLLAIQNSRSNTLGLIGRWAEEYNSYVGNDNEVTLVKGVRATSLRYTDFKYTF